MEEIGLQKIGPDGIFGISCFIDRITTFAGSGREAGKQGNKAEEKLTRAQARYHSEGPGEDERWLGFADTGRGRPGRKSEICGGMGSQ